MRQNIFGKCLMSALIAVLCLASACSSSSFKVTANLKGLGNQNVRVVYQGSDGGIVDTWVTAKDNALLIEGECSSPSLLMVYNSMSVPIIRLLVSGGDNLDVNGSVTDANQLKITGSDVMEEWNSFVVKHKTEYDVSSAPALNAAIEKYVKSNPGSVVSALLVLLDYAPDDANKVKALLDGIDDSAKPATLIESYNAIVMKPEDAETHIASLNMLEMRSDDFEVAKFSGVKPSVIYFWDKDQDMREGREVVDELKMLDSTRVNIVDINIDIDSAGWRNAVAGSSWKHYWVPGSMMNSELLRLRITSTPTIIVTDSLGQQQYRGNNPIKARQTAESL